jgi:hypothetical protein
MFFPAAASYICDIIIISIKQKREKMKKKTLNKQARKEIAKIYLRL